MDRERYLITGSRGFLGSRLAERLREMDKEVVAGGRDGAVPEGVDYVINCGTYGNMYNQTDTNEITRANVQVLETMLRQIHRIRTFINISSTSVLLDVQTPYSLAKRQGEILCREAGAISVRPSSITGKGEQKEHLIPKLVSSCLTGEEIPFVGEPTHDFINVSDVVAAIGLLLQVPDARGQIYNISTGRKTSNFDVLRHVETLTGREANTKRVDSLRPYDTKSWKVDNSMMRELGWRPTVSLKRSIMEVIKEHEQS